jgi:transcriptional regulator with XRE-family HTH domain
MEIYMIAFSKKQKKTIAKQIALALDGMSTRKGGQRKLAAMMGVSQATISHWKKGTKTPAFHRLIQLSALLGVPVHTLCGFSGEHTVRSGNHFLDTVMNLSIVGTMLDRREATASMAGQFHQIHILLDAVIKEANGADLH